MKFETVPRLPLKIHYRLSSLTSWFYLEGWVLKEVAVHTAGFKG